MESLFTAINLETHTACNRRCDYCPNSRHDNHSIENLRSMSMSVLEHISKELGNLNFSGRISPHFYNEPLLDKLLEKKLTIIKKYAPKVFFEIYTNGDFLSTERITSLQETGCKRIIFTVHTKKDKKRIAQLAIKISQIGMGYTIQEFFNGEKLYNRGGLVAPRNVIYEPRCLEPDNPIVIRWNGDVILCCNDYFGQHTFGNILESSLYEIWTSKRFSTIREELQAKIFKLPICRKCTGLKKW